MTSKSQDILMCGFCEVNEKVKAKCMDCDLYLCSECKDKHSKFKHADLHSVVAVSDIHLHKEEDKEFKPVRCKDHEKQLCSIFCQNCGCIICPICIVEAHQKHEFEKLDDICKKKYEEIKGSEKYVHYKKHMHLLGLYDDQKSKYSELQEILKTKMQTIMDIHTRHANKLNEIENIQKQVSHDSSKTEMTFKFSEEHFAIEKNKEEMDKSFESKNTEKFLECVDNFTTRLKSFSESKSSESKMLTNELKIRSLKSICGDYELLGNLFSATNIELTKLSYFPMKNFSASIASNQTNSVWIVDEDAHEIVHLDCLELANGIKTYKFPEDDIWEIRCLNENEMLLVGSTMIYRLTCDGKFSNVKDLSPGKICTLHVTTENNILVGMNLKDVVEKKDEPIIIILGKDGQTILHEYRNSGGQLLKNNYVRCCTSLQGDAVCYIDCDSHYCNDSDIEIPCNSRLVVIDKYGDIRWTYKGHSIVNKEDNWFDPCEVIATENDNIITSDPDQNAIHILSSAGSLLTILDTLLLGMWWPSVMALVGNKFLWVICDVIDDETCGMVNELVKLEITGI